MLRNGGCRDRPAGWARSSRGCSRGGKRGQREGDPTRGSPTSSRYPPASRGWLPAAWRRGSAGSATSSREMPRAENNKLTSTLRHGERKDFFITLYLEHFERDTQKILVEDGRYGENSEHGELLREATSEEGLVEVAGAPSTIS